MVYFDANIVKYLVKSIFLCNKYPIKQHQIGRYGGWCMFLPFLHLQKTSIFIYAKKNTAYEA